MKRTTTLILKCLLFAALTSTTLRAGDPLYPNSVVSNDIDFILSTDPDSFSSLAYIGQQKKEMPDKRGGGLFDNSAYVFETSFEGGKKIGVWCHSDFGSKEEAQKYADKLCPRLGKLPGVMRDMLDHVVIHKGNETAFAETNGHFFVLYSENMDARISTHDLEETVFHESVHASIQSTYKNNQEWKQAQNTDPSFVTDYAKQKVDLEDMPESALFAYTLIVHPGRLSADIEKWLNTNIPNRIAFFRKIFDTGGGTATVKTKIQIDTYPNPSRDKVFVTFGNEIQNNRLDVYNIAGALVKSVDVEYGKNEIDISDLSNGAYFLITPGFKPKRIIKH